MMKRIQVFTFLISALSIVGCDQVENHFSKPKVLKLGLTYNGWGACIGYSAHRCGPEGDEIRQLFKTAFAAESTCQGVELQELAEQERNLPVKDIPGYLQITYRSPGQWAYRVNFNGNFLGATVTNEREAAEQVCRVVRGMGGKI